MTSYIYIFDHTDLEKGIITFYELDKNILLNKHFSDNRNIWEWHENYCHYRSNTLFEDINIYSINLISYKDKFNFQAEISIDNNKITKRYNLLMEKIRTWRNKELENTDKYLISDYPIYDDEKNKIKIYRNNLRNLPTKISIDDIMMYIIIIDNRYYEVDFNKIKLLVNN